MSVARSDPIALNASSPVPFFMSRPGGWRLCVYHAPHGPARPPRAAVVHVHAFGEEMNKSRRMVALQSQALAGAGCAVLRIDLLGCGDSSGLLSDVQWSDWLSDVQAACNWLIDRHPGAPLWLWGHRDGALLASQVSAQWPGGAHLLLWQPMPAGKMLVQQLLRLMALSRAMDTATSRPSIGDLRRLIAEGRTFAVSGYPVSSQLMQALEVAELQRPASGSKVRCLEVSTRLADGQWTSGMIKTLAAWQADGVDVRAHVVTGPAFWQTTEIEEAPLLLAATLVALDAPVETGL